MMLQMARKHPEVWTHGVLAVVSKRRNEENMKLMEFTVMVVEADNCGVLKFAIEFLGFAALFAVDLVVGRERIEAFYTVCIIKMSV